MTTEKREYKTRVKVVNGISILLHRTDPKTGKKYYAVSLRRGGKDNRKFFSTLEAATIHCQRKANEIKQNGLGTFQLTDQQRSDAVEAFKLLGDGTTLEAAVREYLRIHPRQKAESVPRTAARYLRDMMNEGRRRISVMEKRQKFRLFCSEFKTRNTASVTKADVEAWATKSGYTGTNRDNYVGAILSLLNFYAGNKRKPSRRAWVPVTWGPERVEQIMRLAEENLPDAVPWLVLLWFCGMRPGEAEKLTWDSVRLEDASIFIDGEISKIAASRSIDLAPNAVRWLTAYRKMSGSVSGGAYVARAYREQLKELAGIDQWPNDVARHTFATAHYNHHGDAAKTLSQMGHFEGPQTFTRHYKGVMTAKDAAAFWQIEPSGRAVITARANFAAVVGEKKEQAAAG